MRLYLNKIPSFSHYRYIEEGNFKLLQVAANTSKKIIVAQLDALDDINNPGLKELLEGRPRVDISEGTGSGTSYQVNKNQIKSLTETCHSTVFGIGDLITEYEGM